MLQIYRHKVKIFNHIDLKNAEIIGFQRTNKLAIRPFGARKMYHNKVLNKVIDMRSPLISEEIKNNTEVTIDYTSEIPSVNIDLKRNETLAKIQNELFKKFKSSVYTKNILIFYFDSISRVDFRRKLPKLYKWIEQFYLAPDTSLVEAFQFLKYHAVGRYTINNMLPNLFGSFRGTSKFYLKFFQEKGYVTGSAQNHCEKDLITGDELLDWTNYSGYDHELSPLFCDPNFAPVDDRLSIFQGANSMLPRCLYGKYTAEYAIEYTKQFFQKYENEAKIFFLGIMDNHELTAENIHQLDDYLFKFVEDFRNTGNLEKTTIIIQSDHGNAWVGPWTLLNVEDHSKEIYLPFHTLILPKNYFKNFDEIKSNLKHNENSMITPFVTYNSYLALLNDPLIKKSHYSKYNYYTDQIPLNLNCEEYYDKSYYRGWGFECKCEK